LSQGWPVPEAPPRGVDSEEADSPARVMIVNAHRLFAEAISLTLQSQGLHVLGVATSSDDALSWTGSHSPDVVLLDAAMSDGYALELGRRIIAAVPDTKIVLLGTSNNSESVRDAMRAGFHGYVTKDTQLSDLVVAIEAAMAGNMMVPHNLASAAAGARTPEQRDAVMLAKHLTTREKDILRLLTQGRSGEEIAQHLSISRNTVRTHIQNILTKLQVHSRLEAAAFAVTHRLVDVVSIDV
jgi:two-component system nitrate/nitrite response regulator NarL